MKGHPAFVLPVAKDKSAAVIHSAMAAEYRRRPIKIKTERQLRML